MIWAATIKTPSGTYRYYVLAASAGEAFDRLQAEIPWVAQHTYKISPVPGTVLKLTSAHGELAAV